MPKSSWCNTLLRRNHVKHLSNQWSAQDRRCHRCVSSRGDLSSSAWGTGQFPRAARTALPFRKAVLSPVRNPQKQHTNPAHWITAFWHSREHTLPNSMGERTQEAACLEGTQTEEYLLLRFVHHLDRLLPQLQGKRHFTLLYTLWRKPSTNWAFRYKKKSKRIPQTYLNSRHRGTGRNQRNLMNSFCLWFEKGEITASGDNEGTAICNKIYTS